MRELRTLAPRTTLESDVLRRCGDECSASRGILPVMLEASRATRALALYVRLSDGVSTVEAVALVEYIGVWTETTKSLQRTSMNQLQPSLPSPLETVDHV